MAVILVVEDDVFIREIAEMMIQDWGHDTLSASDVDEALSLLRSPQHIDALFTDIYLKNAVLGGCELARQAITLRPELRVLYTTGNSSYRQNESSVCRRHRTSFVSRTRNISSKRLLKSCSRRNFEVAQSIR